MSRKTNFGFKSWKRIVEIYGVIIPTLNRFLDRKMCLKMMMIYEIFHPKVSIKPNF